MDDQESNLPKSAKFPVSSKPGNPLKVAKLSTDSAQGKTSGISTRLSKSPVLTESRSVSPGRRVTRQRRSLSLQSPTLPVQSPSCSVDFPAEPVSSPPGIKRGRGRPPMKRPIKSPPPEPMSEKKKTLNNSPEKTSVKQKIVALCKERSLSKVKSPSKLKKPETITLHDTSSEEEIMLCEITGDLRSKGAVLNPIIQSKVLPDETATGDLKSKDVVLYPVIQPKVLPDETTTGDLRSKAAVLNPVIQPKVVSDEATNDQHINSEQPNKLEKQVQQHEEKPVRSPVKDKEIFSERCGETAPLQKKDSCGSSPEVQGKETLAASPVLEECSEQTVRSPDHLKLTRSLSVPESSSCFKLDKKTDKEENSIDMNTEQNKHEASDNNQVESTINSELSPFPSDSGNTMFMRKSRSGKTEVIVYPKEHYMSSVLPKFAKPPSQQPLCGTTSPNKPSDSPIVAKVHRPGPLEAATGTKVVAVSPPTSKPRSANILEKQKKASENLQKSVVSSISQPASDMRTNPQCIHSKLPAKGPVESRTRKKVTIIRQTTKCINQPISMPHQSPTSAMTGINIKYMGSFALNPKTAAPVNPADVGMKQVLHVPGQQGTMVGISGPVQTFTPQPLSIQPVSGPVISPINPSAMVHQMLSNQIQSVNQHSAVTANQLVQRVPRQDQVQLSMGNSMAQFIQTPTVLPQTLLSSGQIIQPIGTTCQIIQNSPQPVAAPVQNTFQNPLSSGVLVPISQPLSVTLPQTLQRTFGPTVRFSSPQPITTVAASPMISGLSAQSFSVHSAANLKSVSSQSISGNPSGSLVCNRSGIVSSLSSPLFQMAGPVANLHSVVPGTPCIGSSPRSGLNNPVLGVQPSATTQHTSSSYAVPIRHSELPLTSNSISVSSINHSAESTSPTRPSLSNPNILKILLPDGSPSVASPFISALSKDSALKILQELNNKPASSVVKTCTENVVTVNASQHPKLRNMLKNIEETLNTVTPTVSPAVNPQIAKVTEPAKVSVEPPLRRPSVLSPSAIKQMLQSVPGSMRPPPSPQIMLSKGQHGPNPIQQGPRPKLASHLMVKKIMKNVNKILSKPSILTPKRPPLSWIKPLTQAKSFNFETVVDKNGIKTGFVGKSAVRRKMDTVCREDFSSPEPAKLPAPRRVNRYSRKPKPGPQSGRVTKVQGKTRVSQRPTSEGRLMSHPIIHSQRDMSMLPQPEMEEVVTESPLVAPSSTANDPCPRGKDVQKDKPHLMFEITSEDGETVRASSMEEAWRQVTEKVQDARVSARLKQLSFSSLNGRSMFGVDHPAVVYLTEQLQGARNCHKYKFRYFKHAVPLPDDEPEENASGCIRCEEFDSRKPYDMFSFLMSNYRNKPYLEQQGPGDEEMVLKSSRRPTSMDLPMAMRFRHLQAHAREAVGVYRSVIHGRGLFCKRNIDGGEMVIEYAGEVIRSVLTDKREKYYESKGIGCYMFRIDDMEVVDATVHGSAARFINHSCDPNCYSKVINVDGKKHIVIFAMRPIKKGEELTYDYKFPIEEVKIPCTCGSRRCRKYLN